ncbi:MAG TPA: hypothetical protein PKH39_06970 [Woeseiaceae bacterium]|nr:hypothetical protein [Woeseiaceae bacterium]
MKDEDLLNDPGFLAYKLNFETENVEFLPVDRDEIRKVPSLKRGSFDTARTLQAVPLAKVAALLDSPDPGPTGAAPRFIFHTAYCASTFLSRCLDVDGVSVSLREPQIMLDAANAKRLQWRSRSTELNFSHLPELAVKLLRKHATETEKLVIKPINCVNNIIPELLKASDSSRSLMLFTDARNFVLSTLRKGEGGKQTVRSMFDLLRCDFAHLANLQLTHTIHMTDLRVIMTLWRLQIEQAKAALEGFSTSNEMASLYGESLIRQPLEALRAVNEYLQLGLSPQQIDDVIASDRRFIDAKNADERFSVEQREERYRELETFYGSDLDDGLQWLLRNNPGTQLRPELLGELLS